MRQWVVRGDVFQVCVIYHVRQFSRHQQLLSLWFALSKKSTIINVFCLCGGRITVESKIVEILWDPKPHANHARSPVYLEMIEDAPYYNDGRVLQPFVSKPWYPTLRAYTAQTIVTSVPHSRCLTDDLQRTSTPLPHAIDIIKTVYTEIMPWEDHALVRIEISQWSRSSNSLQTGRCIALFLFGS